MVEQQTLNLGSGVTYQPPDTHGYPGSSGVVFSYNPGQLRVGSVSVWYFDNLLLLKVLCLLIVLSIMIQLYKEKTSNHIFLKFLHIFSNSGFYLSTKTFKKVIKVISMLIFCFQDISEVRVAIAF